MRPSATSSTPCWPSTRSLREQLLTPEGTLNRFVNVYVNGRDVRYEQELATPVSRRGHRRAPARDGGRLIAAPGRDVIHGARRPATAARPTGALSRPSSMPSGTRRWWRSPRCRPNPDVAMLRQARVPEPDRLGQGPGRQVRSSRTSRRPADWGPIPSSSSRRAATPASRLAMIAAPQGLPSRGRAARQRDPRAAAAARLFGARDHRLARRTWARTGPSPWRRSWSPATPATSCPTSTATPRTRGAHEETTAEEIIADCPEVDVFVAGLGTGGTLTGVGRRLRERQPATSASTPPSRSPATHVQGLRSLDEGFIPEIFDPTVLDGQFLVSQCRVDRGAPRADHPGGHLRGRLLRGCHRGRPASGARAMERGTVVVLLADGGWKYLSEDVWARDLDADEDDIERLSLW